MKLFERFYLPYDKMLHFFYGFLICYPFILLGFNKWYMLAATLLIGVAKEMIDRYIIKTKFDVFDIVWTILPAILLIIKN